MGAADGSLRQLPFIHFLREYRYADHVPLA
jgi:hypothetical protein